MKIPYAYFLISSGIVTHRGICADDKIPGPPQGHGVALTAVHSEYEKIECDGVDEQGRAINPRVVSFRRPRSELPVLPEADRPVKITKRQYEQILARLTALEKQSNPQATNRTVMFEDGIDKLPKETEP